MLKAWCLISLVKRVILSNVSPCVPNNIIVDHHKQAEVDVVSPVEFVSAGSNLPEYEYMCSFRWQVCVNSNAFFFGRNQVFHLQQTGHCK